MSDRSMAQRMQDDEDHRQALCGLTPDVRSEHELEDFEQRHYDFIFAPIRAKGDGRTALLRSPSPAFFASGRRDPAPHDAKRAQDVWEGSGPHQGSHVLSPPPTSRNEKGAASA